VLTEPSFTLSGQEDLNARLRGDVDGLNIGVVDLSLINIAKHWDTHKLLIKFHLFTVVKYPPIKRCST
jgi:hypothetical protein